MNSAINKKFVKITEKVENQSETPVKPHGSKHSHHHSSKKYYWKVKLAFKVIGWIAFATLYIKVLYSVVQDIKVWENSPEGKKYFLEEKKR